MREWTSRPVISYFCPIQHSSFHLGKTPQGRTLAFCVCMGVCVCTCMRFVVVVVERDPHILKAGEMTA